MNNNKKKDDLNENKNNLKNYFKDIILEGNSHGDYTCVIVRFVIYIGCIGFLIILFYNILFDTDNKKK